VTGAFRPGVVVVFLAFLLSRPGVAQRPLAARDLVLATTTSVRDAGLLDSLMPGFERASGRRVKVLAVGSGQAMEIGRRGEADLLILHDPGGEVEFVRQGFGIDRQFLMHNEFVIVGPGSDPAGIRGERSAARGFRAIAAKGARFISRGDRSGTHAKETAIWKSAGLAPRGEWYLEAGQGMGQTLQITNELQGYALSDVGTFLAHKSPLQLEVLVEGDSVLRNPYHVILANPARFQWVDGAGARALRDYLFHPKTQRRIGEFGRAEFGRSLFIPADAEATPEGEGGRRAAAGLPDGPHTP
jgi:tungstate transport system substrate-binding protein